MAVQDKITACEFSATTRLNPDQIAHACDQAAEAAKVTLGGSVRKHGAADNAIQFQVKGPGGLIELADFQVSWSEEASGSRTVKMNVGDFLTTQDKVLYFIPVSPKSAPAVKCLNRFGAFLKEELAR